MFKHNTALDRHVWLIWEQLQSPLLCNTSCSGTDILTLIMTSEGCLCVPHVNIQLTCSYQSNLNRNAKLVLNFQLLLPEICLLKALLAWFYWGIRGMERGNTQQEKKTKTQTNKGKKTPLPPESKGEATPYYSCELTSWTKKRLLVRHPTLFLTCIYSGYTHTYQNMKYHSSFRLAPQAAFTYVYQPWFKYVRVSSYNFTAGDVAAHITYWKGGCLVSFSCGRLESSCLKIGSAKTSLKRKIKKNFETVGPVWIKVKEKSCLWLKEIHSEIHTEFCYSFY